MGAAHCYSAFVPSQCLCKRKRRHIGADVGPQLYSSLEEYMDGCRYHWMRRCLYYTPLQDAFQTCTGWLLSLQELCAYPKQATRVLIVSRVVFIPPKKSSARGKCFTKVHGTLGWGLQLWKRLIGRVPQCFILVSLLQVYHVGRFEYTFLLVFVSFPVLTQLRCESHLFAVDPPVFRTRWSLRQTKVRRHFLVPRKKVRNSHKLL